MLLHHSLVRFVDRKVPNDHEICRWWLEQLLDATLQAARMTGAHQNQCTGFWDHCEGLQDSMDQVHEGLKNERGACHWDSSATESRNVQEAQG